MRIRGNAKIVSKLLIWINIVIRWKSDAAEKPNAINHKFYLFSYSFLFFILLSTTSYIFFPSCVRGHKYVFYIRIWHAVDSTWESSSVGWNQILLSGSKILQVHQWHKYEQTELSKEHVDQLFHVSMWQNKQMVLRKLKWNFAWKIMECATGVNWDPRCL